MSRQNEDKVKRSDKPRKQKKAKIKAGKLARRDALAGYAFIAPWVIGILIFVLYPLFKSFYYMWFNIRITPLQTVYTYVGTEIGRAHV